MGTAWLLLLRSRDRGYLLGEDGETSKTSNCAQLWVSAACPHPSSSSGIAACACQAPGYSVTQIIQVGRLCFYFWWCDSVLSVYACKPGLVSAVLVKVIASIYRKDRPVNVLVYTAWQKSDYHLCLLIPVLFCAMVAVLHYARLCVFCCAMLS